MLDTQRSRCEPLTVSFAETIHGRSFLWILLLLAACSRFPRHTLQQRSSVPWAAWSQTLCVRISGGWPVWSCCPNPKVDGQENSIEFPLNLCPDFILLYMVCAQWLSKQVLYNLSTDPLSDLHHWLPKHGESNPISPYTGQPARLHQRESPVYCPLFLQSSECLLSPSTCHTTLQ